MRSLPSLGLCLGAIGALGGCLGPVAPIDFGDFGFGGLGGIDLFPVHGTYGAKGNILFGYIEGCPGVDTVPCALETGAILENSKTRLHLGSLRVAPGIAITSSDPSVFEVGAIDADDEIVAITAHAEGRATLLVSYDGTEDDRIDLVVEAPTSLAFADPSSVLLLNAPESLSVIAMDTAGRQLFGRGAIQLDPNGLAMHAHYDPNADLQFAGTDHFVVSGAFVGSTTIVATFGALSATTEVAIADESEVTRIAATVTTSDLADLQAMVAFEALNVAGDEVRGAHCTPSITNASTITPFPEGLVASPTVPGDEVLFSVTHGPATASCAFGGAIGSVQLPFQ